MVLLGKGHVQVDVQAEKEGAFSWPLTIFWCQMVNKTVIRNQLCQNESFGLCSSDRNYDGVNGQELGWTNPSMGLQEWGIDELCVPLTKWDGCDGCGSSPMRTACLLIGAWHNCGHIRSCKRSMVTGSSSYTHNIQGSHLLSILGFNKNSCFDKKGDMDKISGICMLVEQLFMSRKWRFLGNGSRFDCSFLTLRDAPICRRARFRTRSRHSKFISFWDGQNFCTLRTKQVDVSLTIFGLEATAIAAIAEFTADFVPFPFMWSKTTQRSPSFLGELKNYSYIHLY